MVQTVGLGLGLSEKFSRAPVSGWLEGLGKEQPLGAGELCQQVLILRFRLRHRWIGQRCVLSVLERLAGDPQKKGITLWKLKKYLWSMNSEILKDVSALRPGSVGSTTVASLKELDVFLRGRSVEWTSLASFGRELSCLRDPDFGRYFLEVGRLMSLGESIRDGFGQEEAVARPQFCKFCWRFRMTTGGYCSVHSPSGAPRHGEGRAADNYYSGRRLFESFNDWQERLERSDRRLRLRPSWRCAVREGHVMEWIRLWRPHVYERFVRAALPREGVAAIVDLLDLVPDESAGEKRLRTEFHLMLSNDLSAVYKMLHRAEAWVLAMSARQAGWGGARKGSGRRPTLKQPLEQLVTSP